MIGRILNLTSSIKTKRDPSLKGLPWGTKWLIRWLKESIIWPETLQSQTLRAKNMANHRCLLTVNPKGSRPCRFKQLRNQNLLKRNLTKQKVFTILIKSIIPLYNFNTLVIKGWHLTLKDLNQLKPKRRQNFITIYLLRLQLVAPNYLSGPLR